MPSGSDGFVHIVRAYSVYNEQCPPFTLEHLGIIENFDSGVCESPSFLDLGSVTAGTSLFATYDS